MTNFTDLFGTGVVSEIVHARIDFGEAQYGETSNGTYFEFRTNLTRDCVPLYLEIIKEQGLGPSTIGFGLEAFASKARDYAPARDHAPLEGHVAMYINRSNIDPETLQRLGRALVSGLRTLRAVPEPEPTLAKLFGSALQPAIRIATTAEDLATFVAANPEATLRETDEVVWQTEKYMFKINYEAPGVYTGAYYNSPVGDPCEPNVDDMCYEVSNEKLSIVVNDLFTHWAAHKDS